MSTEHKARLAADPRFAGWVAGSSDADLEPVFGPDQHPEAARKHEERRELFRQAGVLALARSRNGRDLDPEARRWAERMAAMKPLGRALGTGEPE